SCSVPRLCRALAAAEQTPRLLSVAMSGEAPSDSRQHGYPDCRFAQDYASLPILRVLRCSSALSSALRRSAGSLDVIHSHGLWLMSNLSAGREAARARIPHVVSPRGMLSAAALGISPIKKGVSWRLWQRHTLRAAACLHATSKQEYHEIRAVGLTLPI